jgi:outer membrane receptor protein involved in Fe transport
VLTLRGLTTGGTFNNSTVGVVVDDVSYSGSILDTGGWSSPDVDPSDLARIEVLRGPQGALYGASSLGGLVKYVTIDPSTDHLNGRVQVGTSRVAHGDGLGHYARGAINVPLSDTLAVRISAFDRREPGYVDNALTGQRDLDRTDVQGGRAAALWRPSDDFSVKLSVLRQQTEQAGSAVIDLEPGLGTYENTNFRGVGGFHHDVLALGANVTARIGSTELKAISGYSRNKTQGGFDASYANAESQQYFGVSGNAYDYRDAVQKVTQEIRLSMPLGKRFDWLLGAFYTNEQGQDHETFYPLDPATGRAAGQWTFGSFPGKYREYAAFTDLTFHITDRFDLQVGGRQTWNRVDSSSEYLSTTAAGIAAGFGSEPSSTAPGTPVNDTAFTYLLTPQIRVSPELMVYARLASGYRPGATNNGTQFGIPLKYGADTTQNYEVGLKGSFFEHSVSIDTSIYYIDWKDIQVFAREPISQFAYYTNAGRARSQGVELAAEWRTQTGFTVSGWVAWNDAKLTEFPSTSRLYAAGGDRLPYSSPFSANLSIDHEFPLTNTVTGFVGSTFSYVDERKDVFPNRNFATGLPASQRLSFASYTQINLDTGIRFDSWMGSLYLNNIADKRGILSGGFNSLNTSVTYIQPRTIGLSIAKTFP